MPSGGSVGGAHDASPPPNGRTTLDLGKRLTNLPSSEIHREGGCCGTSSIMGDSMVTPPNQVTEAMYLQQDWLGKSSTCIAADGAKSCGGAGISPTGVAAFPAFDAEDSTSSPSASQCNEDGCQVSNAHLVLESAGSGVASSSDAALASVLIPNETTSRRKKHTDDLLAQMRKTRFFTNSMFSKKKCGSVKSSTSSRASGKKKTKSASQSITRPDASIVKRSEKEPEKLGNGHNRKRSQVNDVTSAGCHPEDEEFVEVRRTSDMVEGVLLGTKSHGSNSDVADVSSKVVITRVRSPSPLAAIEVCDDANTSSGALVESPPIATGLLPRSTRPNNVKNRATSSDSLGRRERRMQEVLSSLTFDVPTSTVDAENRTIERPWGSVDTAIERSRSHEALSFVVGENAQEQLSIDDDSVTIDSEDSSSVPLNRISSIANSSFDKAITDIVDDKELFYDSDPGVIPVRRKSLASGADDNSLHTTNGDMKARADGTIPNEGGVHMLSMSNSFDDDSSFDAMYRLRDEEVRNVLEVSTSNLCRMTGIQWCKDIPELTFSNKHHILPFLSPMTITNRMSRAVEWR